MTSVTLDPLTLLTASLPDGLSGSPGRFYFRAPDADVTVAGLGVARMVGLDAHLAAVPGVGGHRQRHLVDAGEHAFVVVPFDVAAEAGGSDCDPTWSGMPLAAVVVPRVCVVSDSEGTTVIVSDTGSGARAGAGDDLSRAADSVSEALVAAADPRPDTVARFPTPDTSRLSPDLMPREQQNEARRRVTGALAAIADGRAQKIVVSTSLSTKPAGAPDPIAVLRRLLASQPGASAYLYEPSAGHAFVGASPERLASVSGRTVRTVALAGSAPRGDDESSDAALGEGLLASTKDRAEHELVVDAVRGGLAPITSRLSVPERPRLRKLAGIQHLETPIEGTLAEPKSVLDLAAVLHPTPALAGTPRGSAMRLIRRIEGGGRGLYGGAIGWMDADGDGDLSVAIRCLLVHDGVATAFAGAGIVAGSDPDAEVREMELKLRTALSAV